MDICKIRWRWFTISNGINRITSSVSHWSLTGSILFYFPNSIISPAHEVTTSITYCMKFCLKCIDINRLINVCSSLVFFDNTLITVLMLRIILFIFIIIICVPHGFHIFHIIISISTWCIIFISTWSICSFRIIIIASFLNDLNPGGNGVTCGGRHSSFWIPKVFLSWFGIGSFLGGDVASDFIFIFFLWMRFPGVTLALVSPVNPELTDRSVQSLSTTITSFAGAFDWVIQFGPLVKLSLYILYVMWFRHKLVPQLSPLFLFSYHLIML